MRRKTLRAIDLYSGVGGWSLGLALAGIKVVASYERSTTANETNRKNNRHSVHKVDLRTFPLSEFPKNIDIVVGSPPCTQFSYANRGGNGDLSEGLEDIRTFLAIVDHLRPRLWAMENVPRIANILAIELNGRRGALRQFRHLAPCIKTYSMEQFGLPQRRRRCIVGNFDAELFGSYASVLSSPSLNEVLTALSKPRKRDPIYGFRLLKSEVHEHEHEEFLSPEEVRINRASKVHHPIYNAMSFPDRLNAPSRTITATCTRVGRESVLIADERKADRYRRLTIRERACLQGFPVSFQFYSPSYLDKIRLIGNAMPPLVAFYIAQSFKQVPPSDLEHPSEAIARFTAPDTRAPITKPGVQNTRVLDRRRFRFAIPSLHMKSGVRFELANRFDKKGPIWRIQFFYGTSKEIRTISLSSLVLKMATRRLPRPLRLKIDAELKALRKVLSATDSATLQTAWSKTGDDDMEPLELLDRLSKSGKQLARIFAKDYKVAHRTVVKALNGQGPDSVEPIGVAKLLENATLVAAGILIGSFTNSVLQQNDDGNYA